MRKCCFEMQPEWYCVKCMYTSYEKVYILNRGTSVVLHGGLIGPVAVIITEPIVVEPQVIEDMTTLPPPMQASPLAGPFLLAVAPPHRLRRRRRFGTKVDFSHHGSIYGRPDADPISTDESGLNVVTAAD